MGSFRYTYVWRRGRDPPKNKIRFRQIEFFLGPGNSTPSAEWAPEFPFESLTQQCPALTEGILPRARFSPSQKTPLGPARPSPSADGAPGLAFESLFSENSTTVTACVTVGSFCGEGGIRTSMEPSSTAKFQAQQYSQVIRS